MNECVGSECVKVQLPLDKDLEFIALTAFVKFSRIHDKYKKNLQNASREYE